MILNPKSQIPNPKQKVIFLVGPTAVGKSQVAICLAKKLKAEIISCDSMQIYKGMNIVTSKLPKSERKGILHHMIDILSPTMEYNVSKYYKDTTRKIEEAIKRKKMPILVGGTGLYVSILMDGIFKEQKKNKKIRSALYKKAKELGNSFLYAKLKKIDLKAAEKIHPNDTRRIVRALEVFENTGKTISSLQKERKGLSDKYNIKIFCLNMNRSKLYDRINRRVEEMFDCGLINEVKKLLRKKLSKTALFAIGIRELKGYLEGDYDLEEAKRLIQRNSRLYAKRQLTWFRKDKRIKWINVKKQDKPQRAAIRIASLIRR